jgi:Right handed beta helix region
MMLKRLGFLVTILGSALTVMLSGAPASAQATRTWVSGVGDDVNPCSRTAPCKTWAGAIAKTVPGGEIDALDPGGFGALTITKSITLDGGGGQVASVLVGGTNGIVVAAGATDVVILRNLRFQGLLGNGSNSGNAGIDAIKFISGAKLIVDHCDIIGFNNDGINIVLGAAGFAAINNTTISNVGHSGISVGSTAATGVSIDNVHIWGSAFGLGVGAGNNATLSRSVIANASGSGIVTDSGSNLMVDFTEISNSTAGISPSGNVGLGNSDITFNTTGISGATTSFGNNRIFGNISPGTTPTLGTATSEHGQQ